MGYAVLSGVLFALVMWVIWTVTNWGGVSHITHGGLVPLAGLIFAAGSWSGWGDRGKYGRD